MKFASVRSRASIIIEPGLALDLERASSGTFSHDPAEAYANWGEIVAWAASHADASLAEPFVESDLGNPVPAPQQVFAIGLNYAKHAAEGGFEVPTSPAVFTKFVSCLTGPYTTQTLLNMLRATMWVERFTIDTLSVWGRLLSTAWPSHLRALAHSAHRL